MKKSFLFLLIMLSLSFIVSAAPPFQIIEPSQDVLQIAFPKFDYFKVMNDFDFHIHVYNSSGILQRNDTTSCYFHLYNNSGNHILQKQFSFDDNNVDFELMISGGNFSYEGQYTMISWCNNTLGQGGFVSGSAIATGTGFPSSNGNAIALIIGLGIFGIILLVITFVLDKEHNLFKLIILVFIPLILLVITQVGLSLASGNVLQNNSLSFYKIGLWFIRVYYVYFFMYLFYKLFSWHKMRKQV